MTTTLGVRPAALVPAVAPVAPALPAGGDGLPGYVTQPQARAMINAARTTRDRLLLETLWQSGGRVSEVLRLRVCDLDHDEGAIRLVNLKQQRRPLKSKRCYVSHDLLTQLRLYAHDARIPFEGCLFPSQKSRTLPTPRPMSRAQAWLLVTRCATRAGVQVPGPAGKLRPASPLNFRHGSAVFQMRQGVPLTAVQQQLGHARLDTTAVYTKLANPERRRYADQTEW